MYFNEADSDIFHEWIPLTVHNSIVGYNNARLIVDK